LPTSVANASLEPIIQTNVPVSPPAHEIEPPEIALPVLSSLAPSAAPIKHPPTAGHAARKNMAHKTSAASAGREIEDPWAK